MPFRPARDATSRLIFMRLACVVVSMLVAVCGLSYKTVTAVAATRTAAEVEALEHLPPVPQQNLPEIQETGPSSLPAPPESPEAPAAGTFGADGLSPNQAVPAWANHRLIQFVPTRFSGVATPSASASETTEPSSGQLVTSSLTPGLPSGKLKYWGGAVEYHPELYLLFWGENFWTKEGIPAGLGGELEFFYRGLEKESIVNPAWQGILSQYSDDTGELNQHATVVKEAHTNAVLAPKEVNDAKIREQIDGWLENGAKITPNTQFVVMLAPHTTFTTGGLVGCGYHSVAQYNGLYYAYAVVPYTGDADTYYKEPLCNRLTWKTKEGETQQLMWSTTGVASHEYAETVTEPLIGTTDPPYTSYLGWRAEELNNESEIGDLCNLIENENKNYHSIEELPAKNGRVGFTYVNKLWDDEGGNECKLEDPPYKAPLPTARTENATPGSGGEGYTTATLNAEINPNGSDTHYHFEYGTEPRHFTVSTAETDMGSGTTEVPENTKVTGLLESTRYYFRVVASSSAGTSYGEELIFGTGPVPGVKVETPTKVAI